MRKLLFVFLVAGCHSDPGSEPVFALGQRALSGYHVSAGAATSIPDGDIGYLITANGQNGYRLTFIDTAGSPAVFEGTITTDQSFDPNGTSKYSGAENVTFTADNRIDFSGVPGASIEGLDFSVLTSDPIYLDLTVDGSHQGFGIFFTGARSSLVQESAFDPVAFISP
jgi:hypothetical protein